MNTKHCGFQTVNDLQNTDNSCPCNQSTNSRNSCGCQNNQSTDSQNSCGCQNNQSTDSQNSCGCQNNQSADSQNSCGCQKNCETSNCYCQMAIANVPMQQWECTYPVEKAFICGTIFPELNLPFYGRRNKK